VTEYDRLIALEVSPRVAVVLAHRLDHVREYQGRRTRYPREHGSVRGYQQHRHLGLPPCEPCLDAHAEDQNPGRAYRRGRLYRNSRAVA
jgi:hypothetical protein